MLLLEWHHIFNDLWSRKIGQKVYALLFDPVTGKALDFSAGTPNLATFDGNHNRFGTNLTEDTTRIGYFSKQYASGAITLPNSSYGTDYDIEYWASAASGTFDRTVDLFLGFDKLPWANGNRGSGEIIAIKSQTDLIAEEPASARFEAFVSFSYDSTIQRLQYVCWLEKDGALQTDAISCNLKITDSSGNSVINTAVSAATGASPIAGFFIGSTSLALSPDDNYMTKTTIIDGLSISHASGSSPTTWD